MVFGWLTRMAETHLPPRRKNENYVLFKDKTKPGWILRFRLEMRGLEFYAQPQTQGNTN